MLPRHLQCGPLRLRGPYKRDYVSSDRLQPAVLSATCLVSRRILATSRLSSGTKSNPSKLAVMHTCSFTAHVRTPTRVPSPRSINPPPASGIQKLRKATSSFVARLSRALRKREMNGGDLHLPPGFRFHPTDEELVFHYLCRKCAAMPISVPIIADVDLYKYDPWDLPDMALYGNKEWYFFSPRDRKYPNGSRPNRAAGSGYWKATGADKPVGSGKPVAIKKALVFYAGRAPRGEKTNWIMHEYRLANVDRSARKKSGNLRLDDWVLCRIYNKKGVVEKNTVGDRKPALPKPKQEELSHLYFATSDSLPRLHAESSSSEHVPKAELTCEREVQSQPKWSGWDDTLGVLGNNEFATSGFADQAFADPVFDDILAYLERPF